MDNILQKGFIIDTCVLTIHAFSVFEGGKHLSSVRADIPEPDVKNFARALGELFGVARRVITTPQVLTEFHALARTRASLDSRGISKLIKSYIEGLTKFEEIPISKYELLNFKESNFWIEDAWELCFTDTSLILASMKSGASVLTLDRRLLGFSKKLGIEALNPYYEIYLVR